MGVLWEAYGSLMGVLRYPYVTIFMRKRRPGRENINASPRKFPLHPRYNVEPSLKVEVDGLFHSLANIVAGVEGEFLLTCVYFFPPRPLVVDEAGDRFTW